MACRHPSLGLTTLDDARPVGQTDHSSRVLAGDLDFYLGAGVEEMTLVNADEAAEAVLLPALMVQGQLFDGGGIQGAEIGADEPPHMSMSPIDFCVGVNVDLSQRSLIVADDSAEVDISSNCAPFEPHILHGAMIGPDEGADIGISLDHGSLYNHIGHSGTGIYDVEEGYGVLIGPTEDESGDTMAETVEMTAQSGDGLELNAVADHIAGEDDVNSQIEGHRGELVKLVGRADYKGIVCAATSTSEGSPLRIAIRRYTLATFAVAIHAGDIASSTVIGVIIDVDTSLTADLMVRRLALDLTGSVVAQRDSPVDVGLALLVAAPAMAQIIFQVLARRLTVGGITTQLQIAMAFECGVATAVRRLTDIAGADIEVIDRRFHRVRIIDAARNSEGPEKYQQDSEAI